MRTEELDYHLPAELIAQVPADRRDRSRLMVVRRGPGTIEHAGFGDLPDLLAPADCLILNDTRVLAARLRGRRARTGGKWQGLYLEERSAGVWELIGQTRGKLQPGEVIDVEPPGLRLIVLERTDAGSWLVRPEPLGPAIELLGRFGEPPLPPYIRRDRPTAADRDRYQTVFARWPGAVAAPTAGLHFTPELLERIRGRGIGVGSITLHVGIGTFRPMTTERVEDHPIHPEWAHLPSEVVELIGARRQRGGRTVAVGTTVVRTLETAAQGGTLRPFRSSTGLFIYPPFQFRATEALVTNFHLPRSSLLALVGAFAGVELIQEAYRVAVDRRYRFYSYGDAMIIL